MSIDPNENRASDDEFVLAAYDAELGADAGIAEAIAAMPQPVAPTHSAEAWVKPNLARAESLRDRARIWAPGILGTAVIGVLLIGPFDVPLTGPLIAYGLAWAGFGWWTAAGRPGPRDSALLAGRFVATAWRWTVFAAVTAWGWIRRGAEVTTRPMRRTAESQ